MPPSNTPLLFHTCTFCFRELTQSKNANTISLPQPSMRFHQSPVLSQSEEHGHQRMTLRRCGEWHPSRPPTGTSKAPVETSFEKEELVTIPHTQQTFPHWVLPKMKSHAPTRSIEMVVCDWTATCDRRTHTLLCLTGRTGKGLLLLRPSLPLVWPSFVPRSSSKFRRQRSPPHSAFISAERCETPQPESVNDFCRDVPRSQTSMCQALAAV